MSTPSNPSSGSGSASSPEAIEREIASTRAAIGEDLEALGSKFTPEHIRERAVDSVRGAKDQMVHVASERAGQLGRSLRHASEATAELTSQQAGPLALIGLGAGWLMVSARQRQQRGEFGERTQDRTREAPHQRTERTEERARYALHHARDRAAADPLPYAAAALLAGLGIGLILPVSQREQELLSPAREKLQATASGLLNEGRATAARLREGAQQTAREVGEALR